jgi:hypothetical protein
MSKDIKAFLALVGVYLVVHVVHVIGAALGFDENAVSLGYIGGIVGSYTYTALRN